MLRRTAILLAGMFLAGAGALATTAPAHARTLATAEIVMSPLSLGDYCAAKVYSNSMIGFYQGNLSCYQRGTGGNLVYVGSGNPWQACEFFTRRVVTDYRQGVSQSLICTYVQ
ncbi:hypothetical protein Skr01_22570 [Sphaerisporangium krabiense]|uniref:Beta/gamma crystallin 'Greek key' domain-containing protein n=1 Tax=Sphaerisporangium krabiense TaxID=763782 RepID=A0A7W8Z5U2_9ACTN|nr:hypothetical protein [Sphaerisporangium krabiense]MBB5628008.1 hypothetical protein [Sphaerisporangium krabiense]GII62172.1 hypothetical protein Skr01_22570 [Sphaerisporangium krabiense]